MKAALQTKLGTQLALTPQLRQAIRLLQLSTAELEAELTAAIEANPLLESADDRQQAEDAPRDAEGDGNADTPGDEDGPTEAEDADISDDWAFADAPRGNGDDDSDEQGSATQAITEDLHGHLHWQLTMTVHEARDFALGEAIIDALDDDGYLQESIATVVASVPAELKAREGDAVAMLKLIQFFDPIGCASRSLVECLLVQLAALSPETPGRALAERLTRGHLDDLVRQRPERLAAELGVSEAALQEASALLRSLDPKPGARLSNQRTDYVAPDAIAVRRHGRWKAVLAPGSQPALAINRHYQRLIGHCNRNDDAYLRGQLQEARWLIKALETRASTVLRVAEALVAAQRGFLDHGPEALRPLTLREVAESLGLHESTISRATTHKYLRTPRGTFEFKFFFSSGVNTEHGGGASATAIQARIRKLIAAEDPTKPLSDQALTDTLKAEGVPLARRTVAKYREAIGIPSSSERQRR